MRDRLRLYGVADDATSLAITNHDTGDEDKLRPRADRELEWLSGITKGFKQLCPFGSSWTDETALQTPPLWISPQDLNDAVTTNDVMNSNAHPAAVVKEGWNLHTHKLERTEDDR